MRLKVFLRVAEGTRGPKVAASTKPNYEALTSGSGWNAKPLPTAQFAVLLDVPDTVLRHAEQVLAEIAVAENEAQVAAQVVTPTAAVE